MLMIRHNTVDTHLVCPLNTSSWFPAPRLPRSLRRMDTLQSSLDMDVVHSGCWAGDLVAKGNFSGHARV